MNDQTFKIQVSAGFVTGSITASRETLRNTAFNLLVMGGKVRISRVKQQ